MEAARKKKQITYKGTLIRLLADFSTETLQARREWHDILKVMKGKKPPTKITLSSKALIRFEVEIKIFTDKQKIRDFSTTKPLYNKY